MSSVSIPDIRAEIEQERLWREDELRFLKNHLEQLTSDDEKNRYRKALIVMLYAHFEGGCKAILQIYLKHISDLGLTVKSATSAVAAACLSDVFGELISGKKLKFFKGSLPDDTVLHGIGRRRAFLEKIQDIETRPIRIDTDKAVNTESNLSPIVLRKLLYIAGLEPDSLDQQADVVQKLLRFRNDIAHGSRKDGYDAYAYEELELAVKQTLDELVLCIMRAARSEIYKRHL